MRGCPLLRNGGLAPNETSELQGLELLLLLGDEFRSGSGPTSWALVRIPMCWALVRSSATEPRRASFDPRRASLEPRLVPTGASFDPLRRPLLEGAAERLEQAESRFPPGQAVAVELLDRRPRDNTLFLIRLTFDLGADSDAGSPLIASKVRRERSPWSADWLPKSMLRQ